MKVYTEVTASAFANRTGDVILFGLDEERNFEIIGAGNSHRLQKEIIHLAVSEIELGAKAVTHENISEWLR